jgi:hypothetical protein
MVVWVPCDLKAACNESAASTHNTCLSARLLKAPLFTLYPGRNIDATRCLQPKGGRRPRQLVQELLDEGLPVLSSYLLQSVKIRASQQSAKPMIYLEPRHKLTQEYPALHQELNR